MTNNEILNHKDAEHLAEQQMMWGDEFLEMTDTEFEALLQVIEVVKNQRNSVKTA